MRKVASPVGALGMNEIVDILAYFFDPAFCRAISLVIITASNVEIILFILTRNYINTRAVNLGSLSETIKSGKSWTEKIISMRMLAVSNAVMFRETGMR